LELASDENRTERIYGGDMQPRYVCTLYDALNDPRAMDFITRTLRDSYLDFYGPYAAQIDDMVERSLGLLLQSQSTGPNESTLLDTTGQIATDIIRTNDDCSWFNTVYRHYKADIRPQVDLAFIRPYLQGNTILDFGCGGGYLALALAALGYSPHLTDVLDYRVEDAVTLPFVKMHDPSAIPYSSVDFDTTIVKAVLHHVDEDDVVPLLRALRRVSKRIIILEDTFDVGVNDVENYVQACSRQPYLREYFALSTCEQYHVLVLLDFFTNAIAIGMPEMNFPFGFKSPRVWRSVFEAHGFRMQHSVLFAYEQGKMHRGCQVWMVFDRM
jgi:2-polyprenyl-3-methyl-5-hydroxy-6-metoxy-1,4-benzoquinol methylase